MLYTSFALCQITKPALILSTRTVLQPPWKPYLNPPWPIPKYPPNPRLGIHRKLKQMHCDPKNVSSALLRCLPIISSSVWKLITLRRQAIIRPWRTAWMGCMCICLRVSECEAPNSGLGLCVLSNVQPLCASFTIHTTHTPHTTHTHTHIRLTTNSHTIHSLNIHFI